MRAGARLPGLDRWPASGSVTGRGVLGESEICDRRMPGSEIVGRLSWSSDWGFSASFLSKLERKLEPKAGGDAPEPGTLLKLLGGIGVVLRMAGGLLGMTVPGLMEGRVSAGTPMTPVPGGGIVVLGVRMLLKPREGVAGMTVVGAVTPGTVL